MRIAAHASGSSVDEQFLRDRVFMYLKVLLIVDVAFHLVGLALFLSGTKPPSEIEPQREAIAALRWIATGLLVTAVVLTWKFRPNRRILVAIETTATLLLSAIYVHLSLHLPSGGLLFAILMICLALTLRAAVVPSPVGRTLLVGALAVGANATVLHLYVNVPWLMVLWSTMSGVAFVFVTMVTSKVIYGLRREARAAERLGQYELLRKLGEGGMGVVYEATHVLLRRPTAIKLLRADKLGEAALARFELEVRETSLLEHPSSVYIYDYGRTPDGQFYYAMEFLDGFNLDEVVGISGPLPEARVSAILVQAAHALAEAHAKGIVHRDVKPANIMLCDRGGVADTVKVLDFGLVKQSGPADQSAKLTLDNSIVGTPHYMAPEAIQSPEDVGPATDIYALAAVGYFLVTGRELFPGKSMIEVCSQHLTAQPEPLDAVRGAPVHVGFAEVILRGLEKDPEKRFRDGAEFASALEALQLTDWNAQQAREWWQENAGAVAAPERELEAQSETRLTVNIQARLG